jgi:hypothetical protein
VSPRAAGPPALQAVEVVRPGLTLSNGSTEAGAAPTVSCVDTARDLSELLTEPIPQTLLDPLHETRAAGELAPLFNPAEPFSVPEPPLPVATAPARRRTWLAVAAVLVILASGGIAGLKVLAGGDPPTMASLSVQSNPSGVPVFVDGVERGVTPARITLAPGAHILELRRGVPRVIPLTLSAGAEVSQYLEFVESTTVTDQLTPEAAAVPVTEASAAPAPAAPLAGWLGAKAPFVVEIHENGRLLGTTETDRLMLSAGAHQLEFVNETLGFRAARTVQVQPGKVLPLTLELPHGVVNLNAAPWAEVFIDGRPVGETPIGNLSVPIGPHEIAFRHPEFGEKKHAISVTAGIPVRISVEMRK